MSTDTPLDLGLLFTFRNPAASGLTHAESYAAYLEQIRLADALGYDTIWFGEHHFADDGHVPSPLVAAAAAAATTRRVRIGTCVLLLPFYDTVRLAEDVAVLDVISGGRVDLGVGAGYVPEEFAGFGVPLDERFRRFRESVRVLRGLWTEDAFRFDGEFHRVDGATIRPRPVQAPHPPLWIGAMHERAIRRVAADGHHLLATSDDAVHRYDAELAAHGRDPRDFHVWRPFWVHVGPTDEEAWADAGPAFRRILVEYGALMAGAPGVPAEIPPATELRGFFEALKRDGRPMLNEPLIGSPQTIVADLARLRAAARMTHISMGMHLPGLSLELARRSMELFMREVAPAIAHPSVPTVNA